MKQDIEKVLDHWAEGEWTIHTSLKAAPVREAIAEEIAYEIQSKYIIEPKPDYSGINQQDPGIDY